MWVKAEECTDMDANLDMDHGTSISVILPVLWAMEENGGNP